MRTSTILLAAVLSLGLVAACNDTLPEPDGDDVDDVALRTGVAVAPDDQVDLAIGPTIWTHVDPLLGSDHAIVPGDPDPDRLDPYALGRQARLRYEWLRAAHLVK
jgi:hypothetical protein